jgi:hypothetical protein
MLPTHSLKDAIAFNRCEDEYAEELDSAVSRISNLAAPRGLLAEWLAIVSQFVARYGREDLRFFLLLLMRRAEIASRPGVTALIAYYLEFGMLDEQTSHCRAADIRRAALAMPRPASRSSCEVRTQRR